MCERRGQGLRGLTPQQLTGHSHGCCGGHWACTPGCAALDVRGKCGSKRDFHVKKQERKTWQLRPCFRTSRLRRASAISASRFSGTGLCWACGAWQQGGAKGKETLRVFHPLFNTCVFPGFMGCGFRCCLHVGLFLARRQVNFFFPSSIEEVAATLARSPGQASSVSLLTIPQNYVLEP